MITYILILAIYKSGAAGIEFGDKAACEKAAAAVKAWDRYAVATCVPKASQP